MATDSPEVAAAQEAAQLADGRAAGDGVAGLALIVAGAAGVAQFFLSWQSLPGLGGLAGRDFYDHASIAGQMGQSDARLGALAILAVLIGGGVLIALGFAVLAQLPGRTVLSWTALAVSVLMLGSACYYLVRGDLRVADASVGYFLFLGAGLLGAGASVATVVTGMAGRGR